MQGNYSVWSPAFTRLLEDRVNAGLQTEQRDGMKLLADFSDVLVARQRLNRAVRIFFCERGYLEVDTPIRIMHPAIEDHIDAEPSGQAFLRTSPELHMKRLLASGYDRIFQLAPCFRKGEFGPLHHPEYTMLEWYRANTDYRGILDETKELLCFVAQELLGSSTISWQGKAIDLSAAWNWHSVRDIFLKQAGWDPMATVDPDRFNLDLVESVEPSLSLEQPVILADYPEYLAALARLKSDNRDVAERWELYIGGMELANAYSELTDAEEQKTRFQQCSKRRMVRGQPAYEMDSAFIASLNNMPPTGGIALGMDRLLMLLLDKDSLDEILPFRNE